MGITNPSDSEKDRTKIFILCGPPGIGKTLIYEILRKFSLYEDPRSFAIARLNDKPNDTPLK